MKIGDTIDKELLIYKFNTPVEFRSEIINCCGPKIGGLSYDKFIRALSSGDELWQFEDKSDNENDEDISDKSGFVLLRNEKILEIVYL